MVAVLSRGRQDYVGEDLLSVMVLILRVDDGNSNVRDDAKHAKDAVVKHIDDRVSAITEWRRCIRCLLRPYGQGRGRPEPD